MFSNLELSVSLEFTLEDIDGAATARALLQAVRQWLNQSSLPTEDAVQHFLDELPKEFPWLEQVNGNTQLVFHGTGQSLWSQIQGVIPRQPKELELCGPSLDHRYQLIQECIQKYPNLPVSVLLQSGQSNLNPLPPQNLRRYFRDCTEGIESLMKSSDDDSRLPVLHAKWLWIQGSNDDHLLLVGSANPSAPAWLHTKQNAEAMWVFQGKDAQHARKSLGINKKWSVNTITCEAWDSMQAESASEEDSLASVPLLIGHRQQDQSILVTETLQGPVCKLWQGSNEGISAKIEVLDGISRIIPSGLDEAQSSQFLLQVQESLYALWVQDAERATQHFLSPEKRRLAGLIAALYTDVPELNEIMHRIVDLVITPELPSATLPGSVKVARRESEVTRELLLSSPDGTPLGAMIHLFGQKYAADQGESVIVNVDESSDWDPEEDYTDTEEPNDIADDEDAEVLEEYVSDAFESWCKVKDRLFRRVEALKIFDAPDEDGLRYINGAAKP
jgi:hypothetical protein